MPVRRGKDKKGAFYRWGKSGRKYRYRVGNESARKKAKQRAIKQGYAITKKGYK